jgi:hypothetical protein
MSTLKLINKKQLAEAMGRTPAYVTAMIRAGYEMPYPGRTTLRHALAWLAENQDFIAAYWLTKQATATHQKKRARDAAPAPAQGG